MADLTERLRVAADDQFAAAAEIEKLREERDRLEKRVASLESEIDRLLRQGRNREV